MKTYDTVVIIDLSKGDNKVAEVLDFVEKAIAELGGKVRNVEKWGKRLFAYTIKKQQEGFYALVKFEMPSGNLSKLKGKLRMNETILREMTLVEQPAFPAPVFSQTGPQPEAQPAVAGVAPVAAPAAPVAVPAAPAAAPVAEAPKSNA